MKEVVFTKISKNPCEGEIPEGVTVQITFCCISIGVPSFAEPATYVLHSKNSGSISVVGEGIANAFRRGTGDGDAFRGGSGDGDANNISKGFGNAHRSGEGRGYARRRGSGDGDAIKSGTGEGGARRTGSGKGEAAVFCEIRNDNYRWH